MPPRPPSAPLLPRPALCVACQMEVSKHQGMSLTPHHRHHSYQPGGCQQPFFATSQMKEKSYLPWRQPHELQEPHLLHSFQIVRRHQHAPILPFRPQQRALDFFPPAHQAAAEAAALPLIESLGRVFLLLLERIPRDRLQDIRQGRPELQTEHAYHAGHECSQRPPNVLLST